MDMVAQYSVYFLIVNLILWFVKNTKFLLALYFLLGFGHLIYKEDWINTVIFLFACVFSTAIVNYSGWDGDKIVLSVVWVWRAAMLAPLRVICFGREFPYWYLDFTMLLAFLIALHYLAYWEFTSAYEGQKFVAFILLFVTLYLIGIIFLIIWQTSVYTLIEFIEQEFDMAFDLIEVMINAWGASSLKEWVRPIYGIRERPFEFLLWIPLNLLLQIIQPVWWVLGFIFYSLCTIGEYKYHHDNNIPIYPSIYRGYFCCFIHDTRT